jgi:hypothetical protein
VVAGAGQRGIRVDRHARSGLLFRRSGGFIVAFAKTAAFFEPASGSFFNSTNSSLSSPRPV